MTRAGRRRLALGLRDLSAGAAFGSMAISGELPLWALAVFAVALVLALLDFRPLARAAFLSGVVLAAGAVALYAGVATGGTDLVVAACSFAALITANRMLSETAGRTDGQVLLTSLLMIAGGAALSGELLFAVFLLLFGALAVPSLTLNVMERSLGPAVAYPVGPPLRRVGLGAVAATVGALIFFVAFPRLSWNVAARRASKGLGAATTGLSEGVRLGGTGGEIKRNPRVVARVQLAPDPRRDRLDGYWIAATYGTWTGSEWRDDAQPERARAQVTIAPPHRRSVVQRVELLPAFGAPLLIGLDSPQQFTGAWAIDGGGRSPALMAYAPGRDVRFVDGAASHRYTVTSVPPSPRTDLEEDPQRLAALLQLPPLDPRIPELARSVVGGTKDPLEAATRLQTWLKQNLTYTLELPDTDEDPLAHFLFTRRSGHCEYFASALTVLLRTQGFPARMATGFFGGERVEDEYVLRAGDAHAWTQVWIPGTGFVSVDATPEAGRGAQPQPWLDFVMRIYERVDALWRSEVLDYSMRDQARALGAVMQRAPSGTKLRPSVPREAWIAAGIVALLVYGIWRVRIVRGGRAPVDKATRLRDDVERLLTREGVVLDSGEGLEELAARLLREGHPLAQPLEQVRRRYLEARFSDRPLQPGERAALLRRLEHALRPSQRAA